MSIEILVKEQEECFVAREHAERLAEEIDTEQEAHAMRAEKCHRTRKELMKMQQTVQEIMLDVSFSSSAEAVDALKRFMTEQEQKKEAIVIAEQEYEVWKATFEEETALLEQLYGQRLVQMQKEQLAMEEYNKSLKSSQDMITIPGMR